jgi:hypothetical protein
MGSEIFIVEWRAFIYIMKRKGPRIDPWEKILSVFRWFYFDPLLSIC